MGPMLHWNRLRGRSGRLIRSLIGLNGSEFEVLFQAFEKEMEQHRGSWSRVQPSRRQRSRGAGKHPLLDSKDLLFLILFYFRVYPTQDLLGLLFGGTQSWACKWVHRLTPILEAALGEKKTLPVRGGRNPVSSVEELAKICPELSFIIDGTERPVQRPKDSKRQKSLYSGKKKRHTVKNTIVSTQKGQRVCFLGSTFAGSTHDKKMVDEEPIPFPEGSDLFQDTGYQGYHPPGVSSIHQPRKKKRNQPRSEEDKAFNREVSRTRVRVEHAIGGIKRSHLVSDIYRNRKEGFEDRVMFVACGLHNFRCDMRNPM